MNMPERVRLVLLVSASLRSNGDVLNILDAGDIASIILYPDQSDEKSFTDYCRSIIPEIQARDIAALVVDDVVGLENCGADGVLLAGNRAQLKDVIARFSPQKIVGCGAIKDRHSAMTAGELFPDFLFFGKIGADIRPEPHRKNLSLAEWWSELFEVPAIVLGGNEIESIGECVQTGAEFVALESAVFDCPGGPKKGIEIANQLLDRSFEDTRKQALEP